MAGRAVSPRGGMKLQLAQEASSSRRARRMAEGSSRERPWHMTFQAFKGDSKDF